MAFYRYEIKTKTWICPSCHHAVKKETKNDAIEAGLALCFPIGIAVWGARGIRKMLIKKELTATGDE